MYNKDIINYCLFSGTPYAEFQSIDINSQELRAGNQKLREMLENMDKEQKRLDDLKNTYTVSYML